MSIPIHERTGILRAITPREVCPVAKQTSHASSIVKEPECHAVQLEAKALEVRLWEERAQKQQELLQAAAEREGSLQEQMDALRAQVGETSTMLDHHLGNYAQYQQTITQSNQVLVPPPLPFLLCGWGCLSWWLFDMLWLLDFSACR